jgi:dienelactone hydrolase
MYVNKYIRRVCRAAQDEGYVAMGALMAAWDW